MLGICEAGDSISKIVHNGLFFPHFLLSSSPCLLNLLLILSSPISISKEANSVAQKNSTECKNLPK
jgi:hypothetical protein